VFFPLTERQLYVFFTVILDGYSMDHLLTHTDALLNHVYWFKHDLKFKPTKDHIGSAINWTDISDRKHDFLRELVNTVSSWVYNKAAVKKILDDRIAETGDFGNAATFLTTQAFSKFRPGHPQGQFGELLLFNFIQHFFKAVPLLRKQQITTSTGHERFGADAIHYSNANNLHNFYLGESKCYESKYRFAQAFETSLNSIITTVTNLNKELDLYVYDDFIENELEDIAKQYKANKLSNVNFELVCLIAYNETEKITGSNETEVKEFIKSTIESRCEKIEQKLFNGVDSRILDRINYIIFPIWELDHFLKEFQKKVGT